MSHVQSTVTCDTCGTVTTTHHFKRHKRTCENGKMACMFDGCTTKMKTHEALCWRTETTHKSSCPVEHLKFESYDGENGFNVWFQSAQIIPANLIGGNANRQGVPHITFVIEAALILKSQRAPGSDPRRKVGQLELRRCAQRFSV